MKKIEALSLLSLLAVTPTLASSNAKYQDESISIMKNESWDDDKIRDEILLILENLESDRISEDEKKNVSNFLKKYKNKIKEEKIMIATDWTDS